MDPTTKLIRAEIENQFGTVARFSKESGIPYSTLTTLLNRGVDSTSYGTVLKILNLLGIKNTADDIRVSAQAWDLLNKISELDSQGLHTVKAIVNAEYNRCNNPNEEKTEKAYNGIGLSDRRGYEAIKHLVREVLNEKSD